MVGDEADTTTDEEEADEAKGGMELSWGNLLALP